MNDVQKCALNILVEVIKVIEENNLRYSVVAGTLLGAIRHDGFIPWDDDIDIIMPRKDYDVFMTEAYKDLPPFLKKLDCNDSEHNIFLFGKIHDVRTTYIGEYCEKYPDWYTGVFIDIFPVDGMPNDEELHNKYLKKVLRLKKLNQLRRVNPKYLYDIKGFYKTIRYMLYPVMKMIFPYNYFSNKIIQYVMQYDYDDSSYIFIVGAEVPGKEKKFVNKRVLYDRIIKHKFESEMLNIPAEYDFLLKKQYGNYMEYPPKEQQVSHDIIFCDLNLPIEDYKRKIGV